MTRKATRPLPSFARLRPSSKAASYVKQRNLATNTAHEVRLRKALTALGARYRIHDVRLPGKPDIVFASCRVAVFCDGDFWHGRAWKTRRRRLAKGSNADYWLKKIATNRARDRRVERELNSLGWEVIRVWETDVQKEASEIAQTIMSRVAARRRH